EVRNAADACRKLMEEDRVWVDRLKPSPKQLNIRPYFRNLSVGTPPPAAALGLAATSLTRGEAGNEAAPLTPPPLWGRSASVASRRETDGGIAAISNGINEA